MLSCQICKHNDRIECGLLMMSRHTVVLFKIQGAIFVEKPDTTPAATEVKFEKIEGYNLQVGNASHSCSQRIMIFCGLPPFDTLIHVSATNVLWCTTKAAPTAE